MSTAHRRKKNPEHVRQSIIDAAIHQGMERGLPAISLDKVAAAAGVTKGGLMHHFPSKQALLDATFEHLVAVTQRSIDKLIAEDTDTYGRFTRAYVRMTFDEAVPDDGWRVLLSSTVTDTSFARIWDNWIEAQMQRHGEPAQEPRLQAARYASDGVWGAILARSTPPNLEQLRAHVLAMTRK